MQLTRIHTYPDRITRTVLLDTDDIDVYGWLEKLNEAIEKQVDRFENWLVGIVG